MKGEKTMTVKQISVFVENKPGKLAEFVELLRANGIDMRALSLAEAADFGVLRTIVSDPDKAQHLGGDAGARRRGIRRAGRALPYSRHTQRG